MDKILHINDIIEPKIKYRGSVKVLYIDNKTGKAKVIKKHNAGGPGLFTSICRMLLGLPTAEYVPSYILGYTEQNGQGRQLFTQRIAYASTPILYEVQDGKDKVAADEQTASVIQYTFLVPVTSLKSSTGTIKSLLLYNNKNQVCAQLDFDDADAIDTNLGANLLIYWKLKFE